MNGGFGSDNRMKGRCIHGDKEYYNQGKAAETCEAALIHNRWGSEYLIFLS